MNPFEYVNSINYTKKDIMIDDIAEKAYNPFMINRSLSYFNDTVAMANEMNIDIRTSITIIAKAKYATVRKSL